MSPGRAAAAYLKSEERRAESADDGRCDDARTQRKLEESGGAAARCARGERLEAGPLELRGTEV